MWKKTLMYLSVLVALYGCNFKSQETVQLQALADSLKAEIKTSYKTTETLQEIGTLMDSIDLGHSGLKIKMVEGRPTLPAPGPLRKLPTAPDLLLAKNEKHGRKHWNSIKWQYSMERKKLRRR